MKSEHRADDPEKWSDEDTEAILSRRRFLIESTLAGAGIGALATGCRPQVCLEVTPDPEPRVCLEVESDPNAEPQVCLEVMAPEPPSEPCLSPREP